MHVCMCTSTREAEALSQHHKTHYCGTGNLIRQGEALKCARMNLTSNLKRKQPQTVPSMNGNVVNSGIASPMMKH